MYIIKTSGILHNWRYLIGDIIAMELALLASIIVRRNMEPVLYETYYIPFGVALIFLVLTVAFFSENYKFIANRGYLIEFAKSIRLCIQVFLLVVLTLFLFKISDNYSRFIILLWFLLSVLFVYSVRVFIKKVFMSSSKTSDKCKLFLITEWSPSSQEFRVVEEQLVENYEITMTGNIKGVTPQEPYSKDMTHIFGVRNIIQYAIKEAVDEVLIITEVYDDDVIQIMKEFTDMGVTAHYSLNDMFQDLPNIKVETIDNMKVMTSSISYASDRDVFIKRGIDIVSSLIGLVITGAVTLIVGPAIYISSPGPIFFKQLRVGMNGRVFEFYKFRSMYMDAEERKKELMAQNEMDGLMFKIQDDPRITKVGKFIRRTSIDELPQFWNILKGEMSLVGTRPPTLDEFDQYEGYHKSRLAMKPGLTGMWQATGRSDISNFEEVVALDREYIDNWSLSMDFKIIFKTILMVVRGKGAS